MQPDPDQLRRFPLFESVADEDLETLARSMEIRRVEAGKLVTPQGASGYSFFIIVEGTADVIRDGRAVGKLEAGDFFGEIAIMDGGRRTADVVASSDMTLAAMFGTEFRAMESRMPDVAARIRSAAQERLGDQRRASDRDDGDQSLMT
jgi:CRP-like cAMP-binding protein